MVPPCPAAPSVPFSPYRRRDGGDVQRRGPAGGEEVRTVVAYFSETCRYQTLFRTLIQPRYTARWFDPAGGTYTPLEDVVPQDGVWTAPVKPGEGDAILVLQAK